MKPMHAIRSTVLFLLLVTACAVEQRPILYFGGDPNSSVGTLPRELHFIKLTEGQDIVQRHRDALDGGGWGANDRIPSLGS